MFVMCFWSSLIANESSIAITRPKMLLMSDMLAISVCPDGGFQSWNVKDGSFLERMCAFNTVNHCLGLESPTCNYSLTQMSLAVS